MARDHIQNELPHKVNFLYTTGRFGVKEKCIFLFLMWWNLSFDVVSSSKTVSSCEKMFIHLCAQMASITSNPTVMASTFCCWSPFCNKSEKSLKICKKHFFQYWKNLPWKSPNTEVVRIRSNIPWEFGVVFYKICPFSQMLGPNWIPNIHNLNFENDIPQY